MIKEIKTKENEIIAGNKLIAQFMGDYDLYHWGSDPFNEYLKADHHRDWNELIPVVEKIKKLKIEEFSKKKPVMSALMDVDIKILWLAVVEFIKWYNQNK